MSTARSYPPKLSHKQPLSAAGSSPETEERAQGLCGATGSSFLPYFHQIKTWEGFHLISQSVGLWTLNNPISKTLISAGLCQQGLFGHFLLTPTGDGRMTHGCEHMHVCGCVCISACTHMSGGRSEMFTNMQKSLTSPGTTFTFFLKTMWLTVDMAPGWEQQSGPLM